MILIRILFICHGNICRSPMAEFVFRQMAEQEEMADRFDVASAATTDEEIWNGSGNPVYPPVERLLREHGMNPDGKRAVLLTAEDYDFYDYFIGMDDENLRDMKRIFHGDPDQKCHLLMDYTANPRPVADPWYTRDFQRTWDDVQKGCQGLLNFLQGLPG